jgi:hypothetical protein
MSENEIITFNETVCCAEFGADGCKLPPEDEE